MRRYAVITMDVEDWYHTYFPDSAADRSVSLLDGLDAALDILRQREIRGSFFVVGELAEGLRGKLLEMEREGHDVGCHHLTHRRPLSVPPAAFAGELRRAKEALEAVLGHAVSGYRAPAFALDDERLGLVRRAGFRYDASKLQPQKSAKYGALRLEGYREVFPCVYRRDGFTEFEVSSQKLGPLHLLLGGGYLRMLPWCFMRSLLRRYLRSGKPYVLYLHPIDLSARPVPPVRGAGIDRFLRARVGRRRMKKRFLRVLDMLEDSGYAFVTFEQLRKTEFGDEEIP